MLRHFEAVGFRCFHFRKTLYFHRLLLPPTCSNLASKVGEWDVSNTRFIQTCATVVQNKFLAVFKIINQVGICNILEILSNVLG